MEKKDGNVTNMFFPDLSLITVFDEEKYCSKQFSKIITVYNFWDFIVKTKWNISQNVSIQTKWKLKKLKVPHITFFLLLVKTHNSVYKKYYFEVWKLLVSCSHVKSKT